MQHWEGTAFAATWFSVCRDVLPDVLHDRRLGDLPYQKMVSTELWATPHKPFTFVR